MQRIIAAAAALLLASCNTVGYPPNDPYGSPEPYPYPPAEPYPPVDPYPPGQGYPPGPGYPPGQGYPPGAPVDACPIHSSRDWRASVIPATDSASRPTLVLTGTVVAPTGGYRMEFVPNLTVLRSYPVQVIARLLPIPPQGPATQALVTHDLRWQWPLTGPVGTVTIRCGTQDLAQVRVAG